ncbi:MAG TPA: NUMOD4 motif-containing HNH endonuclease [Hanamia sp.]|nr:NUMOD4 motif-containing HNH endonuclease [Hanamia sp.]
MKEQWKDIIGFEGVYRISNIGGVKSLERSFLKNDKKRAYFPDRILTPFLRGKYKNYYAVKLCRSGKEKTLSVHRLVAEAFVSGYFDGAMVNHKDGNTLNNFYKNLEWVTNSQNQIHAYKTGLNKISKLAKQKLKERSTGSNNKKAKPVLDLQTGIFYDTIRDASKAAGIEENKFYCWLVGRHTNKSSYILI